MARDKLTEYDATAANNTVVGDVNLAENSALPSDMNNAVRELMSHLKEFADGTNGINVLTLADDDASASIKFQAPSAVTATVTFTLPDGDGADGQALITNGSGTLAWAYPYGNRNLVINGSASVNQRGDSTGVTATGYHGPDRFQLLYTDAGTWSISQSSTAPEGFANSYKLDCTTAKGTLASNSRLFVQTKLEGQNLQHLKKGTSNAVSTTLSFFVRSNKTGTYQVNLEDNDNTRIIGATYTISSANTFEHKTITFAGDTSGAFADDNGDSLSIMWALVAGTDNSSGAVPTAWEAKSNTDRGAGLTVNLADSTSNEWYITGIQLEVGSVGTDFDHSESYGETLAKCQRYFFQVREGSGEFTQFAHGRFYSTSAGNALVRFPQAMRANPTLTALGATGDYDFSPTNLPQAGQVTTTANTAGSTSDVIAMAVGNNFSSVTSGAMYILGGNAGTGGNAGLQFDAEL